MGCIFASGVYPLGNAASPLRPLECTIHTAQRSRLRVTLYLSIAGLVAALLGVVLLKRFAKPRAAPPVVRSRNNDSEVRCFTCGLWVPKKQALEKKGRYFCGVKKSERTVVLSDTGQST